MYVYLGSGKMEIPGRKERIHSVQSVPRGSRRARNPKSPHQNQSGSIKAATMAALLRQGAARRLGGSMVQQAETQGRRRLMHTDDRPRPLLHTMHPDEIVREIQHKKEELYDAIAKVDDICKTLPNMRLHQHLAAEITPRPNEYVWKKYYSARRTSRLLKKVGILTLPFTVPPFWEYSRSCLGDKKVAPAMTREEEHEAISRRI